MRRRADLKTGYDCNCNCVFCVIGDKLFSGDRSTDDCLAELKASRATCEDVVFTGAEVTIRDDFFVLVAAAKRLGYARIQIQTNGRMLAYRQFAERAVAAGANEFSPSIHGATAKVHDAMTRARGSFDQVVACIENVVALGQRVVTNTVVTPRNAAQLPALASMLVRLGVAQFQIAFPHPTGHADTLFAQVVPRMAEVAPQIHAALQVGMDAGVPCMAEAMPFCMMAGYEPQVAELHIPPTEIVYDGYVVPDYEADRVARGKRRFAQCRDCRWEPICEGPWREYPERRGEEEFVPVAGARVVDRALVLDGVFARLGTPAPRLPDRASTGRWTAVVFYAEDFSPTCTTQLCGLQRDRDALLAANLDVVAVSPDSDARHAAFAAEHSLEFPLHADRGASLARAFAAALGRPDPHARRTVLIDPAGNLAHLIEAVDPAIHAAQVLEALARLQAPPRPLAPREDLVVLRRGTTAAGRA